MVNKTKIRCAIYTRKSSEEGLEQEFNSLDAQRVAAEAYIQSQVHEGWHILSEKYDDGGFSGGTLKRPALEKLIQDIKAHKIDTVVVYKVDRLSRSLHDFARLVDLFDKYDVTFVSVTQAFNTTNSMGRLTLNILLSFAQFEREVTGERIRDKLAASKKKGLWMGGHLPLGYDLHGRELVVNHKEAVEVKFIFKMYLQIKSIRLLVKYLNEKGYKTKRGKPYTKHSLRTVLLNVLYIGQMTHKGKVYKGEQSSILDKELWDKVQSQICHGRVGTSKIKNQPHDFLLKGKVFDETGAMFTTTYTQKKAKRYNYYVNESTSKRMSMTALNDAVMFGLKSETSLLHQLKQLGLTQEESIHRLHKNLNGVVQHSLEKVVVYKNQLSIFVNMAKLSAVLLEGEQGTFEHNKLHEIKVTFTHKSYAGRKSIYLGNESPESMPDIDMKRHDVMAKLLARAFKLYDEFKSKPEMTITSFAWQKNMDRTYLGDLLKLRYLSPEIVTTIIQGKSPSHLNASMLIKTKLPRNWQQQKDALGIK